MATTIAHDDVQSPASPFARLAGQFAKPCDRVAALQCLSTLVPIVLIWAGIALLDFGSVWSFLAAIGLAVLLTLFLVRVFVLMHDCGHDSLFRSRTGNRVLGFVFGVLSGMPQMVWARHHQYHHQTNGNWEKYRGPLNVITLEQYQAMSPSAQRRYRWSRSIWLAPLGGFFYLIFSPRPTWLRATVALARHALRGAGREPDLAQRSAFGTSYCASLADYRHMLWNNVALLLIALCLAISIGPMRFLLFYLVPLSFAGGAAIVLFSVQHNFEDSYASDNQDWDRQRASIDGTSFLLLPKWLNWFTADIAYHHVHHLCARVPNYRLAECHDTHRELFSGVRRITLAQVPHHARCILWDRASRRIVAPTR